MPKLIANAKTLQRDLFKKDSIPLLQIMVSKIPNNAYKDTYHDPMQWKIVVMGNGTFLAAKELTEAIKTFDCSILFMARITRGGARRVTRTFVTK